MAKIRKPKLFIGIDPGRTGAICAYDGEAIRLLKMLPFLDKKFDVTGFVEQLKEIRSIGKVVHCCVEHQQTMGPPTSPRAAFTAGESYGALKSALQCSGFPMETSRPSEWKKSMGVSRTKKKGETSAAHRKILKEIAIRKALALAPDCDFRISNRARKPHDGLCEAFLLAVVSFRNNRR